MDDELQLRSHDSLDGKNRNESLWTVHQVNYQRTRYVYQMYSKYKRINRKVYDYCIKNGYADKNLIAKWKKPGYEKLCSTFVIDPRNFPFRTVALCRVPKKERFEENKNAKCSVTGCLGCYSGKDSLKNIFGNKYGQNLARIQILREKKNRNNVGWIEEDEDASDGESESETKSEVEEQPTKKVRTT